MAFRRLHLGTALLSVLALHALDASAQELQTRAVDMPRFNPAPAGDRFFGVPSPYAAGDLTFHSAVTLDYAREPLTLVREAGDDDSEDVANLVSDQLILNVGVLLSLGSRVAISADMPFALLTRGEAATSGDLSFQEPSGQALGDLRFGARVRLFGEYHEGFQLGVGGYLWVPTGGETAYVSNENVRGQPQLLLGGRADRFIWTAMAGPTFKGSSATIANVNLGHQMNWGAGVGVLLAEKRTLQLHVETSGGVDIEQSDPQTTNAELIGGLKWRLPKAEYLEMGIGAGPGLTTGIGTPMFRGVFQLAYTPVIEEEVADTDRDGILDDVDACPKVAGLPNKDPRQHGCPALDSDKDGILDDVDACPNEAGIASSDPKKHGCPVRDSDNDGILDDVDACPNEAGVASSNPKKHGCPLQDKDGDGVEDDVDACIDIPGVATTDPATNGCPPDTDGDGFRDDVDACPREKGPDNKDPSKRGCPRLVVFTDSEVKILEQVQFDFGKATIRAASDELLNEVAQVLKDHTEVLKLEVQGHTDIVGNAKFNKKLSEDRAQSVMAALVKRGIDQSRLFSTGYGFDKPIGDNKTDAGRQMNRRVQFIVTEKKPIPVTTTKQGVVPPATK
jgi:OmpA-OmpF porin, OOP family